jgi:Protein of unknown function (DUF4435)
LGFDSRAARIEKVREFLTDDREANQIRLRRSSFSGTFLLVEGSSDNVFYQRFIDKIVCQIVVMAGKIRVIGVLDILNKSNFDAVLAIVDADFDRLENSVYEGVNLLYTDTQDLETMLIDSPALDKVIAEFGSEEKIAKLQLDVRISLVEAGRSIGYLRWISQCDRLNLTFSDLKFSKFIDDKTLQMNELDLIQEVKNKSQAFSVKTEYLQQRIADEKNKGFNPWQVCCGHDLVEILALGLRKAIGTMSVDVDSLERNLRLAYEEVYFRKTQLWVNIRQWESNNQLFQVLAQEN